MKVLMLTPYLPYPLLSGGQIRTYNLLKQLAPKHEITLFSLIKHESEKQLIKQIAPYCKKVQVFRRSEKPFTLKNIFHTAFSQYPFLVIRNHVAEVTDAVKAELMNTQYDLIHAETFYMMPHLPKTNVPTILVEQTIEYSGYESYAKKAIWPVRGVLNLDINKIRRWEKHYWQIADRLIVMSNEDKKYITQHVTEPNKIDVVANGVDINWFTQKTKELPSSPTVLFVGTFNWLPNREAVRFLVNQVWPLIYEKLPKAKLMIVGNAPTTEVIGFTTKYPNITVQGGIPDIRDAFSRAHILIAPVFDGKGTRYKILEAMASQTAIVATKTAVEGLGLTPDKQVLIADTAPDIAKHALELLTNDQKREQLAQAGLGFVTTHYDWSLISRKLDKIYQTMGEKA